MKYIVVLIFLTSLNAKAGFYPVGKEGAKTTYKTQEQCEKVEDADCFNIVGKDVRYYDVLEDVEDDFTKPLYGPKYNLVSCISNDDCYQKQQSLSCNSGDHSGFEKNSVMPGFSAYCKTLSGYEKKVTKKLVVNNTKRTSVLAEDAEKKQVLEDISKVAKDSKFGEYLMAYVSTRVRKKNLNLADTKTTLGEYSGVISLLRSGSITLAKEEIQSLTPDGTRITQEDKEAILAEIDEYLK